MKKKPSPNAIAIAALNRFAFQTMQKAGVSDINAIHTLNLMNGKRAATADEMLKELRDAFEKEAA